jgi:mRNA-degrading endonuclease RelE of RelBE toxin-antitoxin system
MPIKVGDYRVIIQLDKKEKVMTAFIGHRRNISKNIQTI